MDDDVFEGSVRKVTFKLARGNIVGVIGSDVEDEMPSDAHDAMMFLCLDNGRARGLERDVRRVGGLLYMNRDHYAGAGFRSYLRHDYAATLLSAAIRRHERSLATVKPVHGQCAMPSGRCESAISNVVAHAWNGLPENGVSWHAPYYLRDTLTAWLRHGYRYADTLYGGVDSKSLATTFDTGTATIAALLTRDARSTPSRMHARLAATKHGDRLGLTFNAQCTAT